MEITEISAAEMVRMSEGLQPEYRKQVDDLVHSFSTYIDLMDSGGDGHALAERIAYQLHDLSDIWHHVSDLSIKTQIEFPDSLEAERADTNFTLNNFPNIEDVRSHAINCGIDPEQYVERIIENIQQDEVIRDEYAKQARILFAIDNYFFDLTRALFEVYNTTDDGELVEPHSSIYWQKDDIWDLKDTAPFDDPGEAPKVHVIYDDPDTVFGSDDEDYGNGFDRDSLA